MDEIRIFRSADVVFFAGRGWRSKAIAFVTMPLEYFVVALATIPFGWWFLDSLWSSVACSVAVLVWLFAVDKQISHVGIIAKYDGRAMLFESTTMCDQPCEVTHQLIRGGQGHNPVFRIDGYKGRVYIARVRQICRLRAEGQNILSSIALLYVGQSYNTLGAMISGTKVIKWWVAPMQKGLHAFCSQMVAVCLKRIDMFPKSIHSAAMHPAGLARMLVRTKIHLPLQRIK